MRCSGRAANERNPAVFKGGAELVHSTEQIGNDWNAMLELLAIVEAGAGRAVFAYQ